MSDLVRRARNDREAFGQLYDLFYPKIFRYCVRRLFSREMAEDVTSEIFLSVAKHIGSFAGDTEEDFQRWVYRIATNEINATIRRMKRHEELLESAVHSGAVHSGSGPGGPDNLDALDWPMLSRAIRRLKPREQTIIALRFFEQMSHEQIAGVLKRRPGAVRVALSRALKKLRKQFDTAGESGSGNLGRSTQER